MCATVRVPPESHRTGRLRRRSRWSRLDAAVWRGAHKAARRQRESRENTMAQTFTGRKRVRKLFGSIKEVAEMPILIEVQKASYDQFLLVKEPVGGRPDEGLQAVFKSVFPISDFSNSSMLDFVKYEFAAPK